MPIVDTDGRLFGRVNVVDAVIVLLLAGLIPLAYGAYALFRTPAPQLVSIEPVALTEGPELRVRVRGENFRPYMRISFNDIQGNTFVFRNTTLALVDLNPMPPGVYDVVLYDNAQERSRLRGAFTITPAPLPASEVMVVGTLGNLNAERAATLKTGMTIEHVGRIENLGTPMPESTRVVAGPVIEIPIEQAVRVPVLIRAACAVRAPQGTPQCAIGDAPLQPSTLLVVNTPIGPLPFQVDQVRGLDALEAVRVDAQVVARRAIVSAIHVGDLDVGQFVNPLAAGARIDAIGAPVRVGDDTDRVDITLTVQAQHGSTSWVYAGTPLRAGASLLLRTGTYEVLGVVLQVRPEWSARSSSGATP